MIEERKTAMSSLRNVATLQTLVHDAKPRGRPQVANRLARLENERARLEREIAMWENCRRMAADKFAKVRREIETLRPMLNDAPAKRAVGRKRRGQSRALAATEVSGPSPALSRTMRLEY